MSNEVKSEVKQGKKIDLEYQGYVFLGWASGMFQPDNGKEKRPYHNMYVFSPVSTFESEDYKASGFKAEKKKCIDSGVWEGFHPGDKVKLFFDDKSRIIAAGLDEG